MALSKIYTLKKVRSILQRWLNELDKSKLDPTMVDDLINLATIDTAEILNGAKIPDYGKTANLSDAASSLSTSIVTGATYTNSTRKVTKTTHGFTSASIGRRIAAWVSTTRIVVAEIESIVDVDNFITTKALGDDAAGTLNYAVFSAHSGLNLDLSSLKMDKIEKLVDSINGEVLLTPSKHFDNLDGFDEKQSNIFYYQHGETIFLYQGTSVASIGTLTLHYYGYPALPASETDYLDIRDKYIPLVIAKAKNYLYEHLEMSVPKELLSQIDQKTASIRGSNLEEKKAIKQGTHN